MAAKPSHDTLIHCEACGEDYSSTYRRCPFCGARNDPRRVSGRDDPKSSSRYIPTPPPAKPERRREQEGREEELDDAYVFDGQDAFDDEPEEEEYYTPRPKGGKRLAPKESGSFELPPINWPRLITFLCSLVIIVAALVIVFTFIYPKLHKNPDPKPDESAAVSAAPSAPVNISPDPVGTDSVDQPTLPVEPTAPATNPPTRATVVNADVGLRVRSGPGTSYQVLDSVYNGRAIDVLGPADNGWYNISYTKSDGSTVTGYIMGDYISTISGSGGTSIATPAPSTPAPSTPAPNTQAPTTGGNPAVGRPGTIVGADSGLRVRSGPGTSYEVLDSLFNGNPIQVLSDEGGGWFRISYAGPGGQAKTGYIMGDYISTN